MTKEQVCLLIPELVCLALCNMLSPLAAQSVTYVSDRTTAVAGAATMTSSGYESTVLVAQQSPTGAASACNAGNISSFGFWSTLGDLPLPIVLRVQRNPTDPGAIDLTWTGADSEFQVCRDISPASVCATPFAFSFVCQFTDTQASGQPTLFYNVIPKP